MVKEVNHDFNNLNKGYVVMKIQTKEQLQEKEFLTVRQASIYAERSIETIRHWYENGLIEASKDDDGYRYLIPRASIDSHLAKLNGGGAND